MREAFVKEMEKQLSIKKEIYLLTADLGFSLFENIQKKFPSRFINVGVAESNMVGVAAGLALTGKTVFVYSIATFATYRTFEHIRNDICQHNLAVIVIGTGAGLSYPDAGPSHHALEDLALLKAIPNMSIFTPSDPSETAWAVKYAIKRKRPAYIRLGKKSEFIEIKRKLKYGKANILSKGKDFLLITTGNITYEALNSIDLLKSVGINGTLLNYPMIKPFDRKTLLSLAPKFKIIVTLEEHSEVGGLSSSVSETLVNVKGKFKLHNLATPDKFTKIAGEQSYLREKYGLSGKKVAKFIKAKL